VQKKNCSTTDKQRTTRCASQPTVVLRAWFVGWAHPTEDRPHIWPLASLPRFLSFLFLVLPFPSVPPVAPAPRAWGGQDRQGGSHSGGGEGEEGRGTDERNGRKAQAHRAVVSPCASVSLSASCLNFPGGQDDLSHGRNIPPLLSSPAALVLARPSSQRRREGRTDASQSHRTHTQQVSAAHTHTTVPLPSASLSSLPLCGLWPKAASLVHFGCGELTFCSFLRTSCALENGGKSD
jgi:hypothetical protein